MTWQIKYQYQTGDSYGYEDREAVLEMEWEYLDVAKENLRRIKEHYQHYDNKRFYSGLSQKELDEAQSKAEKQEWYVKKYDACLKLKADNGNECQISAPWCGYFESLHSAEIITKDPDDDDMRIEF